MLILPLSTPSSGLPPGVTSPGDGALNYVTGALTASRPSINVAQTWNNAAVPFDADLMDITDTASAAGATVFRRRVNGANIVRILKTGQVEVATSSGNTVFIGGGYNGVASGTSALNYGTDGVIVGTGGLIFSNGSIDARDLQIRFNGPNVANQRNSTAAQTYRLERTYTDPSNRGYTDFAQDPAGGARLNSVWTGSVAAPTNLLDVQGNGVSRLTLSPSGLLSVPNIAVGGSFAVNNAFHSLIWNGGLLGWAASSGVSFGTQVETAIGRSAAGVLEINNGTAGQFRDLQLRTLFSSFLSVGAGGTMGVQLNYFQPGVGIGFAAPVGWFSGAMGTGGYDLTLYRDAANTLAQRNGGNAQAFNIYNTYTDPSNYEKGFMRWNSGILEIGTQAAGTGLNRGLALATSGVIRLEISAGGSVTASGDVALGGSLVFGTRGRLNTSADGVFRLLDDANTGFNRLCLGGNTASFPALKRSAATLQARLADDSGFADFAMRDLYLGPAAVAGTITPTHTMTIYANGVAYKVPCVAA
jgi:hypothetical protein